jgi:hypothetical protein
MFIRAWLAGRVTSLALAPNRSLASQSDFDLQREMKRLNDNRLHEKALALFDTYEKGNKVKLSEAVVTQALKACAQIGDTQRGSRIYKTVSSRIRDDPYTMTSLIHLFSEFDL